MMLVYHVSTPMLSNDSTWSVDRSIFVPSVPTEFGNNSEDVVKLKSTEFSEIFSLKYLLYENQNVNLECRSLCTISRALI